LDFNSNGCVTPISTKPTTKPTTQGGGGGGVANFKCAMACVGISGGQQYVDCMTKCAMGSGGGSTNISIYKSAIGISQYN
jgi:hypothetical protein